MNYSIKVIGIKDANKDKIKDFIEFEKNWLSSNGNKHKILILHYLLNAFGGNSEEIEKFEKCGYEVYAIDPRVIGGVSDVHFKSACKEYNYKIVL